MRYLSPVKELQPETKIWDKEVSSLSPIEEIKSINDSSQLMIIHDFNDAIVSIDIVKLYVSELKENDKKVNFMILENEGNEIAIDKKVFEVMKELIESKH